VPAGVFAAESEVDGRKRAEMVDAKAKKAGNKRVVGVFVFLPCARAWVCMDGDVCTRGCRFNLAAESLA